MNPGFCEKMKFLAYHWWYAYHRFGTLALIAFAIEFNSLSLQLIVDIVIRNINEAFVSFKERVSDIFSLIIYRMKYL